MKQLSWKNVRIIVVILCVLGFWGLLRMGNQSTKNIAGILLKHKADIENITSDPNSGILEIY